MTIKQWPRLWGLTACALALALTPAQAADPQPIPAGADSAAPASKVEVDQLKVMLENQQHLIEDLRKQLTEIKHDSTTASAPATTAPAPVAATPAASTAVAQDAGVGTYLAPGSSAIATAASALAVAAPQGGAAGSPTDALQKAVDKINSDLHGFKLSGDLRFRTDILYRAAEPTAPSGSTSAQQRARERYRFRLNIDKDMFWSDKSDRALAKAHIQLATDPLNNPITQDTDFSGIVTRAPISINEAWVDFLPTKQITLRAGRTTELFADNLQYVYDDDVRFNGFHEIYKWSGKNGFSVQFGAAQYILTDPNKTASGSYVTLAGYTSGHRLRSSDLLDQGVTVSSNIGKKWSQSFTLNYFTVTDANQIQLASVDGTGFNPSAIIGTALSSNLGGTGNATTTASNAIFTGGGFDVVREAWTLNYSGGTIMGHKYPFKFWFQASQNTKANDQNDGYMSGFAIGQTAKPGDVQFQYQFFYKPANAFISQFSDDDVGTGSGVNLRNHQFRINFGLTRFLAWENRFYVQSGISTSDPAKNFFVPLQKGYNTQLRIHSQLVFTF